MGDKKLQSVWNFGILQPSYLLHDDRRNRGCDAGDRSIMLIL